MVLVAAWCATATAAAARTAEPTAATAAAGPVTPETAAAGPITPETATAARTAAARTTEAIAPGRTGRGSRRHSHIDRFGTFAARRDLEFDTLAFFEHCSVDVGGVHEEIGLALAYDESKPSLGVEKLDDSRRHLSAHFLASADRTRVVHSTLRRL